MAQSAFGATISVGGSALAEVTAIGIPALTAEVIDVTTHGSTNRWRQFVRGLRDAAEFTVTMKYTAGSATDDACIAAITSDTAVAVEIVAKAASGTEDLTFNAFGTSYEVNDLEIDSDQTATLTLKPTGAVTQAAS